MMQSPTSISTGFGITAIIIIINRSISSSQYISALCYSSITIIYSIAFILYLCRWYPNQRKNMHVYINAKIFNCRCAYILTRLMLYTRLASPVAVCIAIRGRYTRLAWLPNPNPNPINPNYG